jgi:hypothetical protein
MPLPYPIPFTFAVTEEPTPLHTGLRSEFIAINAPGALSAEPNAAAVNIKTAFDATGIDLYPGEMTTFEGIDLASLTITGTTGDSLVISGEAKV